MEKDGKLKIVGKYAWADKHGVPINHMLVIRSELSRTRPDLVREVFRIFKESRDIAIRGGDVYKRQTRHHSDRAPATDKRYLRNNRSDLVNHAWRKPSLTACADNLIEKAWTDTARR